MRRKWPSTYKNIILQRDRNQQADTMPSILHYGLLYIIIFVVRKFMNIKRLSFFHRITRYRCLVEYSPWLYLNCIVRLTSDRWTVHSTRTASKYYWWRLLVSAWARGRTSTWPSHLKQTISSVQSLEQCGLLTGSDCKQPCEANN